MSPPYVCLAMSFDSLMFEQAQQCMKTIHQHKAQPLDICVVSVNLSDAEIGWLKQNDVTVFVDIASIHSFKDAPAYAYSQTCRPVLKELFPGYEIYMWVDADIRFANRDAFDFYLKGAMEVPQSAIISLEVDPTYAFVRVPQSAAKYHLTKIQRLNEVYGPEIANNLAFMNCYNTGIFAMHRDSKLWHPYQENLQRAITTPFHHMKEQDAMNVAIDQNGGLNRNAPAIMNWLCSISAPVFAKDLQRWVRPEYPHLPISVLHLTESNTATNLEGGILFYEHYKRRGLT